MVKAENLSILIRVTDDSQYNALRVFEEELIKYWMDMGVKIRLLKWGDVITPTIQYQYDLCFSMNGALLEMDDYALKNYFNMPLYAYYVDHPLWHNWRINRSREQHCIVVGDDFKGYVDGHCQLSYEADVLMQAGVEGINSKKPFKERKYPVVFCGSYRNCSDVLEGIKEQRESFAIFLNHMIEEGLKDSSLTIEDIYNRTLEYYKFPLENDDEYTEFLSACGDVEDYLRGYYRASVIKQIVEAGIPIEIYGYGWEQLDCTRRELLHCHAPVDYHKMLDVFADAQIVLNVMPWVKTGFHDRIACGMLNGALVVSDETRYMREEHLDEDKLILYSLQELQEMPQKVAYYLEHLDEAASIAQKGYQWARENHTWKNRAEQFLRIFQKYQDEGNKAAIR